MVYTDHTTVEDNKQFIRKKESVMGFKVLDSANMKEYKSFSEMCKAFNMKFTTVKIRVDRGIELIPALIVLDNIKILFFSLDGKAHYKIDGKDRALTTREVIEVYKQELLEEYDRVNKMGLYRPYRD